MSVEHDDDEGQQRQQQHAASLIQRNYRGYKTRREMAGLTLSADDRWKDLLRRLQLSQAEASSHQRLTSAGDGGDVGGGSGGGGDGAAAASASQRWRRGGVLVAQLAGSPDMRGHTDHAAVEQKGERGGGDDDDADQGAKAAGATGADVAPIAAEHQVGLWLIERWTRGAEGQALSKIMEEQYWLEMVDKKHRYGSNLKFYHRAWMQSDTRMGFFQWLDEGEGKRLDLPDCPRERLEKERITYLSAEQRLNYLVEIREGRLYWQRNGKPVDTSRNHKDLGKGRGIVELGAEELAERRRIRAEEQKKRRFLKARNSPAVERDDAGAHSSDYDSSSASSSSSDDDRKGTATTHHYSTGGKGPKAVLSPARLGERLLRKTIGTNTWIYVFNAQRQLFVGIKTTGQFQHSSFLYGGRVLSAGLLRCRDGVLTSLSPLSGHYRAGTAHFRCFVRELQTYGVDLSHVTLSKSLLMLYGLEKYSHLTAKSGEPKASGKKNGDVGTKADQSEGAHKATTSTAGAGRSRDASKRKSMAGAMERIFGRAKAEDEKRAQEEAGQAIASFNSPAHSSAAGSAGGDPHTSPPTSPQAMSSSASVLTTTTATTTTTTTTATQGKHSKRHNRLLSVSRSLQNLHLPASLPSSRALSKAVSNQGSARSSVELDHDGSGSSRPNSPLHHHSHHHAHPHKPGTLRDLLLHPHVPYHSERDRPKTLLERVGVLHAHHHDQALQHPNHDAASHAGEAGQGSASAAETAAVKVVPATTTEDGQAGGKRVQLILPHGEVEAGPSHSAA